MSNHLCFALRQSAYHYKSQHLAHSLCLTHAEQFIQTKCYCNKLVLKNSAWISYNQLLLFSYDQFMSLLWMIFVASTQWAMAISVPPGPGDLLESFKPLVKIWFIRHLTAGSMKLYFALPPVYQWRPYKHLLQQTIVSMFDPNLSHLMQNIYSSCALKLSVFPHPLMSARQLKIETRRCT